MSCEYTVKREIIVFAFRYALDKEYFAPILVTETIKDNIDKITTLDIELFISEIEEHPRFSSEIDRKNWSDFLSYLKMILSERKKSIL